MRHTRHLLTESGGLGDHSPLDGPPPQLAGHVDLREVRAVAASDEPVEVRAADDDAGRRTIIGHAAVFDRMSEELGFPGFSFRERIKRGAFRKALDEDQDVRLLIDHQGTALARTRSGSLELSEDPRGLRVYARVNIRRTDVSDLVVAMEDRDIDQMSFGFTVAEDEWVERHQDDGTVEVVRTITQIDRLFDVSVVTFPAYPQTDAAVRGLVVAGSRVINPDGTIDGAALRQVAWRAHHGEVTLTREERDRLDAAFADHGTVSPWVAQRALMAACLEPELLGAIPGKRAAVTIEDAPAGGQVRDLLAARQRRLRLMHMTSGRTAS